MLLRGKRQNKTVHQCPVWNACCSLTIVRRATVPWCVRELPAHSWALRGSLDRGNHTPVMSGMNQDLGLHPLSLVTFNALMPDQEKPSHRLEMAPPK